MGGSLGMTLLDAADVGPMPPSTSAATANV